MSAAGAGATADGWPVRLNWEARRACGTIGNHRRPCQPRCAIAFVNFEIAKPLESSEVQFAFSVLSQSLRAYVLPPDLSQSQP